MDLVTRLRTAAANNNVFATRGMDVNQRPLDQERRMQCEAIASLHHEAADEIERLRAENRTLRNVGISQMEQINALLAQPTNN